MFKIPVERDRTKHEEMGLDPDQDYWLRRVKDGSYVGSKSRGAKRAKSGQLLLTDNIKIIQDPEIASSTEHVGRGKPREMNVEKSMRFEDVLTKRQLSEINDDDSS